MFANGCERSRDAGRGNGAVRVPEVTRLLAERRAGSLAVVDDERLVGTVTQLDIVRALRLQEIVASQPLRVGPSPGQQHTV